MPKLSATRNYRDQQSPVQSDFDAFIDDIEILVNTIKLDDDNFQDGGIDASLKLVDGSIQANQIRNNNITTAKLADSAVTTAKIANSAITTDKLANASIDEDVTNIIAGYLPPGSAQMFHTFNGTVSVPRGWMICNGDIINETNYNSLHGAGAYAADSVASSPLLNKHLPNMDDRYAVGVADTTKDGSSAIAAVGNTDHEVDFSHTHDQSHRHSFTTGNTNPNTQGSIWASELNSPDPTIFSDYDDTVSDSALSATQSVKPESIETLFILKVV